VTAIGPGRGPPRPPASQPGPWAPEHQYPNSCRNGVHLEPMRLAKSRQSLKYCAGVARCMPQGAAGLGRGSFIMAPPTGPDGPITMPDSKTGFFSRNTGFFSIFFFLV
jgi:hypothetical protein